jgi:L-2,4-diaminobutyrate decarboxylase
VKTLQQAYAAETFRREGHSLIDQIADHLKASQAGEWDKVLPWKDPEILLNEWDQDLEHPGDMSLAAFFDAVLRQSFNKHVSRDMGHQVTSTAPLAVLAELLSAYINSGSGVYEVGTVSTVFERRITELIARRAGYGPESGGVLTSGGTLGNLTALLAARQAKAGKDVWTQGGGSFAVMVSAEAHYSIDRVIRIMGWGSEGIISVPVDADFRLDPRALESCYREAVAAGKKVIAVVGNAGSTATGAFDPLDEIADFCAANDLWFHVDGAHGGAVIFSERHRALLKGLERVDSFIFDFHKLLLTPALVTAVMFRNGAHAYETFAQKAQYLWQDESQREWYNLAKRTFECTKPILSLKVYTLLQAYGTQLFEEAVDQGFALAREMAILLREAPDFELLTPPVANILCYRFVPAGYTGDLNALNLAIRRQLIEEGEYFIVQTTVQGVVYLRSAIMNPLSSRSDFTGLMGKIRAMHVANQSVDLLR